MTTPNIDLLLSDIWFRRGYSAQSLEVTVRDGLVDDTRFATVSMGALINEVRATRAERDAAVQACRLFVEWLDSEASGSGVTNEERDTAQGKAKWQAWRDGNMELCGKAMDAARAVIAMAQEDA